MSGWDLHVEAVRTVLSDTDTAAGKFEGEFTTYGDSMASAAKSAGTMAPGVAPQSGTPGPVAAALQEFADSTMKDLQFLPARAGKSISGAVKATEEYIDGDLRMAQDAQNDALSAPTLPPPGGKDGGDGKDGKGDGK